jgi:hypothetical protein
MPSLRARIAYKDAQKARGQNRESAALPHGEPEAAWPPPEPSLPPEEETLPEAERSGDERQHSGDERRHSGDEHRHSGDERRRSGDEPKKIPLVDPKEKQGRSLEAAWKNAVQELTFQLPRQVLDQWVRPLRPGGWNASGTGVVLLCPNGYVQEWCRERMGVAIQRVLGGILGQPGLEIEYRLQTADGRRPTSVWATNDE